MSDERFEFLTANATSNATTEEIAAVSAVLDGALDELAAAGSTTAPALTTWQRGRRPMRAPLTRGDGAWRGFSG